MQIKINRIKKIILLISIIMLFTQCCSLQDDDELSLPLKPYTGNQLRIDGYYYCIGYDGSIYSAYIFYNNGVLRYGGGVKSTIEEMDDYLRKYLDSYPYSTVKYWWGVFVIEGDVIKFERWYPSERPYKAFVREGIILNDTTFHITKSYRSNGTNVSVKDEVYHFRQFSPKPDSTNNFIK